MKYTLVMMFLLGTALSSQAQFGPVDSDTSWKAVFRESHPITHNLVHTKLEVSFDYDKSYLYGKEWLTLKSHFYPSDSVELDAKGMEFKSVSLMQGKTMKPAKYRYDGHKLNIKLDRVYTANENFT